MSAILRRKRLQDGTFGELGKVFGGETDQEKVVRLDTELVEVKGENFALMLAATEMYEEQYMENLNLMLAITELYEMLEGVI